MEYYDIVIIGGGPAGATLARLLPDSKRILLIDKKDSENEHSFMKPCGGLLAPDAQKSISKFGLNIPLDIMVSPQIFAVDTIDFNSNIQKYYNRFYLNLDRHKLDLWLMSLIPHHVTVESNSFCESIIKTADGYKIGYSSNGEKKEARGKYIVGADGANSIVRKNFDNKPIRQYLSIQKSYKIDQTKPYYVCFFDDTITDCYGWINMKNDTIQLGAALDLRTAKEDFDKLENAFLKKGYPFENPVETEACLVNRPKSISEISLGKDGTFLIGEAAGFISTSSLEGISFAMDSALELAKAFKDDGDVIKNYRKNARKLKIKAFSKIVKSWFIYNKFLRRLIMKSGITSVKINE